VRRIPEHGIDGTTRFTDRVRDYVKYRPDYPRCVLDRLREMGLGTGMPVADVGSGTGIFSALLLESGASVYAVEPNEAMRRAAEEWLGGNPAFRSVAGTAEETGLQESSVRLVTAAQAFHWFDAEGARAEFARILQPGGLVALVWNSRRDRSTPFLEDYEALLRKYGTDYGQVNHRQIDTARLLDFFGGEVDLRSFPHAQELDEEGLRGRLLSSSYVPAAGHPDHLPMLAAMDELFVRHARNGRVKIDYDTELYYGTLR
jgi:SAM-dependent methyltransferase